MKIFDAHGVTYNIVIEVRQQGPRVFKPPDANREYAQRTTVGKAVVNLITGTMDFYRYLQ